MGDFKDLLCDVAGIEKKTKKTTVDTDGKSKKAKEPFPLPFKSIGDIVLGADNRSKIIAKVSPINADLLGVDDLSDIADCIQGALCSHDGRIQIIIQSERIDLEKNIINIEKYQRTLNEELKVELLEEQKTFYKNMTRRKNNILNFYIVLETSEKDMLLAEQILSDSLITIKNELEEQDIFVDRLYEKEIKDLIYERFNPDSSQVEPFREEWGNDEIEPEYTRRHKDGRHLEIENMVYRHFCITRYPKTVDRYRWLKKMLTFKGNMVVSIIMNPKSKIKIGDTLSNAVKELDTKAKENQDKNEALRQEYQGKADSARRLIGELGSDNVVLYDTNITISIGDKDIKGLERQVNSFRAKISSTYCQSTELRNKGFSPFFITLPILYDHDITRRYVWNLTSSDVASLIVFDSAELMEEDGRLVGENVKSDGLVIVNTYNRINNNPHLCIIADSGAGKSFFIACNIIRDLPYMDYTIQFDLDGSANFPWATKYKFIPGVNVITNPFHIRNAMISAENAKNEINVGAFLAIKIMDLITFFKWIIPEMTAFEIALLEEDLRDSYEKFGLTINSTELPDIFPTLDTLDEVMKEKISNKDLSQKIRDARENILATLNPYIHGTYSTLFNGQTSWDYKSHTIFDVSNTPEAVQNPLYELLLKDTWQFCKKDGTLDRMERKVLKKIVIDEEHRFADENNPLTLKFISTELLKQGRKFGINVVHATQNIVDLTSIKKYGQGIIDNSFFKIFFRLGENDHEAAKKLYRLSDEEMKIIRGNGSKRKGSKGKGIFMQGSQRVLFQSRASKFELEIIDPDQYKELYNCKSRFA